MVVSTSLLTRFISQYRLAGGKCGIRTFSPLWTADHNEHSRHDENEASHKRGEYDDSSKDSDSSESGSTSEGDTYMDSEEGEYEVRKQILDAALPFVHTYGWSQEAIVQGAESLGYSGMAHSMFSAGGVDLVNHFYRQCNNKLEDSLSAKAKEIMDNPELKKGTTPFIGEAVEERLRMNIEYITSWHKALALHASPWNTLQALDNIGSLVDIIWYHAGDRSHDFNWYTKRGLLAAVYKSSELCMLQDKSDDFQDTWDFMNRRLSDVHKVGKCFREVDGVLKNAGSVAKAGIITGLNIMGLNNKTR